MFKESGRIIFMNIEDDRQLEVKVVALRNCEICPFGGLPDKEGTKR